jgi:hypothetical protein
MPSLVRRAPDHLAHPTAHGRSRSQHYPGQRLQTGNFPQGDYLSQRQLRTWIQWHLLFPGG